MSGKDRRLQNVTSALSAKERAVLVLRSWKEGKDEDRAWRWSMPDAQAPEFNRLIGLMNGVNRNLAPLVLHLQAGVEMLSLRLGWLTTILLWQWNVEQIVEYIRFETKEPVTEREYRELEQRAREEYKPVAELAELLVERHEDWAEADLEPDQGDNPHDEVIVTPGAWERVRLEKEREMAALVKEGGLQGRGRAKGLQLQVGSFYNWLGEPAPVKPEWAREYVIVPDEQTSDARWHRSQRQRAQEAYQSGPTAPVVHLPDLELDFGEPSKIDELVETHRKLLHAGVEEQWRKLGAVNLVVAEVAADFGGEDPALPEMRHVLEHCEEKLLELRQETQRYTGPFELQAAREEDLALVRGIVEREL